MPNSRYNSACVGVKNRRPSRGVVAGAEERAARARRVEQERAGTFSICTDVVQKHRGEPGTHTRDEHTVTARAHRPRISNLGESHATNPTHRSSHLTFNRYMFHPRPTHRTLRSAGRRDVEAPRGTRLACREAVDPRHRQPAGNTSNQLQFASNMIQHVCHEVMANSDSEANERET